VAQRRQVTIRLLIALGMFAALLVVNRWIA